MPRRAASASGTIVAPPSSRAASAASRSPAMNRRRPSAARSAPETAAPSVRLAPTAMSNVAISVTRATPGDCGQARRRPPRPGRSGRIDVATTSPGMTSAIQAPAATRAFWLTAPSATTAASPTASGPMVRIARLRSRVSDPRASRSSRRNSRANGAPAARVERPQDDRQEQRGDEQDRVDDERSNDARIADAARPDQQSGDGHRRRRRPPASRAGRDARSRPRSGPSGPRSGEMLPARRAGPSAAASVTTTPTTTAATKAETGRLGSSSVTIADGPDPGDHDRRQQRADDDPEQRPDDAEHERLAQDEPGDLAAGRAGGPQEAQLAGPLDERHRQRVEDEECAGEQRDRGDERGRRLEVRGGRSRARRRDPPGTTARTAR